MLVLRREYGLRLSFDSRTPPRLSQELADWLQREDRTPGSLVDAFGSRSFPVLFVVLLALPALPLPTGGASHVLELICALVALQTIVGRREVWLPRRWREHKLTGAGQQRLAEATLKLVRRFEAVSRPRLPFLLSGRASEIALGLLAICGSAAAFLAPPFTGLDTLPALGVVVLSLGVLLQDALVAVAGVLIELVGIALIVLVGGVAFTALGGLL